MVAFSALLEMVIEGSVVDDWFVDRAGSRESGKSGGKI